MPKKKWFGLNLDSIWKEGKGKPGGRVEKGLTELSGKDSIDKNLDLGLIEEVQWTEIDPAELRNHLDKAEESLNKLPHSENVTDLKSHLAQTRKLLDEAKIPSSKLTSEQRKSGVYDEDALREVSNRIANLEKRIQKAVDRAAGALGGEKSADERRKDREKAGKIWERLRKKRGKSKRVCDEEVAAKMKVRTRTIERWRKAGWKPLTKSDVK
jgi:hypothetical protein